MYFGALIQLPSGNHVIVEAEGQLALLKFMAKIGDYAKTENRLVKVCCDDIRALDFLSKQLKEQGTKVEYGVKGTLEMELNQENEKTN